MQCDGDNRQSMKKLPGSWFTSPTKCVLVTRASAYRYPEFHAILLPCRQKHRMTKSSSHKDNLSKIFLICNILSTCKSPVTVLFQDKNVIVSVLVISCACRNCIPWKCIICLVWENYDDRIAIASNTFCSSVVWHIRFRYNWQILSSKGLADWRFKTDQSKCQIR